MPKVNPEILRWARETAGLSLEEAGHKLYGAQDISAANRLSALENGEIPPTRSMLLKMSKQYHRSLVIFYMANPPQKGNRGQDFRTLPQNFSSESKALVDILIRNIQARQSIIRSELADEEGVETLAFVKSMHLQDGVLALVESIKGVLKFDTNTYRKKASPQEAFLYLRSCAEAAGIFVILVGDLGSHHSSLSLEAYRGFSIADNIAPFVVINSQDSKAAWSFTLVHELVHIWLGQTGVSNINCEKRVEQFCNDVASEFLLPRDEINQLIIKEITDLEGLKFQISDFASLRNLSNSMVAYKLYRSGHISKTTWFQLNQTYQTLWENNKTAQRIESRAKNGGPNYYVVHRYYLGSNLISTVQNMLVGGTLTTTKASRILGIKPKNIQKLIEAS